MSGDLEEMVAINVALSGQTGALADLGRLGVALAWAEDTQSPPTPLVYRVTRTETLYVVATSETEAIKTFKEAHEPPVVAVEAVETPAPPPDLPALAEPFYYVDAPDMTAEQWASEEGRALFRGAWYDDEAESLADALGEHTDNGGYS